MNLLTVRQVQAIGDGDYNDGGGLVLRVRGKSSAWVFRFTSPAGKRREMGLGICDRNNASAAGRSLTDARQLAHEARALLQRSIDPIECRNEQRAALRAVADQKKAAERREQLTLARAARRYHEQTIEPNRSTKHGGEWIRSLENHVPSPIWHKAIAEVTAPELLDAMVALVARVPETGRRVLQRLQVIFDDAMFRGDCVANPAAAIKRKLTEARRAKRRGHFAAMPYSQVPAFVRSLRNTEGIAARCLELTIYTACRTGESIGARWSEFDLQARLWTIPAHRMKGGEPHTVFLSSPALAVLEEMWPLQDPQSEVRLAAQSKHTQATTLEQVQASHPEQMNGLASAYVFPGRDGAALSNMALLMCLRRMGVAADATVHGFRSSFSTWAYETAAATPDAIEAALAHREADRVKRAYNRATFLRERAQLMQAWSAFLSADERQDLDKPRSDRREMNRQPVIEQT